MSASAASAANATAAAAGLVSDNDADGAAVSHGPSLAVAAASQLEYALTTLHRACTTLQYMLARRGYLVTRAGESSFEAVNGLPPLHPHVTAALRVFEDATRAHIAETEDEILIEAETPDEPQLGTTAAAHALTRATSRLTVIVLYDGNVKTIRSVMKHLKAENRPRGIILSRTALTAFTRTELSTHAGPTCTPYIEHFLLSELQGCIDNHVLTPRQVPLTPLERQRVRERYRCGKLPRLLLTDPMARFLGLRCGDMVGVWETFGREQPTYTVFEAQ